MFKTFNYWSHSQLALWRKCPFAARLRYIDHEPGPPPKPGDDDRRERGKRLHKNAEDYVTLKASNLFEELEPFSGLLGEARGLVEDKIGRVECEKVTYFDQYWRPTTADGKWLIVVPDLKVVVPGVINMTVDYKSGKKFGNEVSHYAQVELYTIASWKVDPDHEEYVGEVWYLDQKDVVPHAFHPKQLERSFVRLDSEVARMMEDKIMAPRPNKVTCKWCDYSPRGTGICPVGV